MPLNWPINTESILINDINLTRHKSDAITFFLLYCDSYRHVHLYRVFHKMHHVLILHNSEREGDRRVKQMVCLF